MAVSEWDKHIARGIIEEAEENQDLLEDPDFFTRYSWAKWILHKA